MRPHLSILRILPLLLVLASCGQTSRDAPDITAGPTPRFPDPSEKNKPQTDFLKDEIPPSQLDEVVRAHLEGLGHMERYEYRDAVRSFREVHERAPGWIAGSINLALALLNEKGTQAAETKHKGGSVGNNFDEALALLDAVVARAPDNLNAHYSRGLILEFLGGDNTAKAHRDFLFVTQHDQYDGHAWYKVGSTLAAADDPSQPAGPADATRLIEIYEKALDRNPNLVTAIYKLQSAYSWARRRDDQNKLLARWRSLNPKSNPAAPGDTAEAFYGESGKYARIINPFGPGRPPQAALQPPRFDTPAPVRTKLGAGERWAKTDDFVGPLALLGRARARFGATAATFDADGDGRADLFLAAAVKTPTGLRDALLLNKGDGVFEDVSHAWGLPDDRASLGVAAADFDADRRIDLFLCGPSGTALLRNLGASFKDVTAAAGIPKTSALAMTARWLDLDQDGDLDLYVVNHCALADAGAAFSDKPGAGVVNAAFRNDGKPAPIKGPPEDNWAPLAVAPPGLTVKEGLSIHFSPWPDASALLGPKAHYTAVAALDVDEDRDLDLVLAADDRPLHVVLNDRLGAFRGLTPDDPATSGPWNGILVTDFDKDGRSDLVAVAAKGKVGAFRNATDTTRTPRQVVWAPWPIAATGWRSASALDLDLDTWPDLIGLPARQDAPVLHWSRNDGKALNDLPLAVGPAPDGIKGITGFVLADLAGDALPDVLTLSDGAPPTLARNLGNGRHWLALALGGRWKTSFDHMRTNPHGLGTRIRLEGQGLLVTDEVTTPAASLAQSVGPVVLGLDASPSVELVRLAWPDGTMQCELNQKADVQLALNEVNRKTGSCPVLFTWNGARFVCVGDFLGGGGLGYLVAPGVYGQPDRDESVAISSAQLQPVRGVYRLSVTEPMDEVAYLDRLQLVVIDRPPGVTSALDERFAPEGPRPTGAVIAWTETIAPVQATDLKGRDVTARLAREDRDTVDDFRKLQGWIGYAEEHGIILDFGDRLRRFTASDRLVLALAGWVEYPYSQTNYAAATAGVTLRPPVIERRNPDGSWSVIEPGAGYPAGLPRLTTLDLTGKLTGPSCVLRIRTNMECYWDAAFLAVRSQRAESSLVQTTLPVARAVLGTRGYSREVSPDGKEPLLYDYDHVDPAPLALMGGMLTRLGDVKPLLANDDDQLCVIGPGDEARLEFDASGVRALPAGWTRSYVLQTVGYCKDADPLTACSDRVEPLPWRGMPAFPFAIDTSHPTNPNYRNYLREFQTRSAGGR